MCDQSDQKKQQTDLLVEEWKQNVALYIDQDKRGFTRIQWFWALNGGFFILFQYLPYSLKVILALIATIIAVKTHMMSRRAHDYIRLREVQARLIENKLKELINPCSFWETNSGILTTFSREHAIYRQKKKIQDSKEDNRKDNTKNKSLKLEINTLGCYTAEIFKEKRYSMKHSKWLDWMFGTIIALWALIFIFCLSTDWFLKPSILTNETSYRTVVGDSYGKIYENKSDKTVYVTVHVTHNCIKEYPFFDQSTQKNVKSKIELPNYRSATSIVFSLQPDQQINLSCSEEVFLTKIKNRLCYGEKTGLSYIIDPL
jgi:hypothetical protein